MVPAGTDATTAEIKASIKERQAELKKLQRELEKAKKKAKAGLSPNDSDVESLAAQITLVANNKGVTKKEVIQAVAKKMRIGLGGGAGKKRAPATVKYRHPGNPELTWVGRGAMPKWLRDEIAKGKKKESFAV